MVVLYIIVWWYVYSACVFQKLKTLKILNEDIVDYLSM